MFNLWSGEHFHTQFGSPDFYAFELNTLQEKILEVKAQKNAVILAHYYQSPEVQEIADYVGDSLGLSIEASKTNADIILFAGVYFMAETAKIINPSKVVLIPDEQAGCSLADDCQPDEFREFITKYHDHIVVTYINCSAEIKAMSNIVCTSANALSIINSIPAHQPILFAPDKNLGAYLNKKTGREMVLWDGSCVVHELFSLDKIIQLCKEHPDARIVAHPESESAILKIAHFIGSTSEMIKYVQNSESLEFIVATEAGILHEMAKVASGKKIIAAPVAEDNICSCSECAYMKRITLPKILKCLETESPQICLSQELMERARMPITKMLTQSRK